MQLQCILFTYVWQLQYMLMVFGPWDSDVEKKLVFRLIMCADISWSYRKQSIREQYLLRRQSQHVLSNCNSCSYYFFPLRLLMNPTAIAEHKSGVFSGGWLKSIVGDVGNQSTRPVERIWLYMRIMSIAPTTRDTTGGIVLFFFLSDSYTSLCVLLLY